MAQSTHGNAFQTATAASSSASTASTDQQDSLNACYEYWLNVNLEAKRPELDSFGVKVAKFQEQSSASRRRLAEATREHKRLPPEQKTPASFHDLLKKFQDEVDSLTRRAKHAESGFVFAYKVLYEAPDPAPALASGIQTRTSLEELIQQNASLSKELFEYKKESEEIKDQSMTIKKLREQLRAAEEERDKLKKRAKKLMAEKYGTIVEPSEGDADSEQIITDDIDMAVVVPASQHDALKARCKSLEVELERHKAAAHSAKIAYETSAAANQHLRSRLDHANDQLIALSEISEVGSEAIRSLSIKALEFLKTDSNAEQKEEANGTSDVLINELSQREIKAEAQKVIERARDAAMLAEEIDAMSVELAAVKAERAELARKLEQIGSNGPEADKHESESRRAASLAVDLAAAKAAERVARTRLEETRSAADSERAQNATIIHRLENELSMAKEAAAIATADAKARPTIEQWTEAQARLEALSLVVGISDPPIASTADESSFEEISSDGVALLRAKVASLEADLVSKRVEVTRLTNSLNEVKEAAQQREDELAQQRALIAALEGETIESGGTLSQHTRDDSEISMAMTLAKQRNAYRDRARKSETELETLATKCSRLEHEHHRIQESLRQRDIELRRLLSERAGRDALRFAEEADIERANRRQGVTGGFAYVHDRVVVAIAKGILSSSTLRSFTISYLLCLHSLVFLILAWMGHRGQHHLSVPEIAKACGKHT